MYQKPVKGRQMALSGRSFAISRLIKESPSGVGMTLASPDVFHNRGDPYDYDFGILASLDGKLPTSSKIARSHNAQAILSLYS